MNKANYISVILPLKLEWEPCYRLPEGDSCCVTIGDRVKVRFANRSYSGVVSAIGIEPKTSVSRIKEIDCLEEGLEKILPEEIELWRKVAEYYLCTIGEVYKAAYPASRINLEEAHAAAIAKSNLRRERLLEAMRCKVKKLKERLDKKEALISESKEGTKAKVRYTEEAVRIRKELATAASALSVAETKAATGQTQHLQMQGHSADRIVLNEAQQESYGKIEDAFRHEKPILLHGVTGSGKTEIYIKAALSVLEKGKNVLYLVPEIALSRQLKERLYEHFNERLLVFHSAETPASRRNTAESIRNGKGYIVLGTRSALFLPHHDLGLIIVDEEHDNSYKQDSPAPRYNGRDTALMLSVIHRCNIILGSATPSLEEIYNCQCGKHVLIRLMERYHGSEDSDIEIIDTKAEKRKRGMIGNFSRKLISRIQCVLDEGGQVMILRSRRSWAPALQCEECGEIPKCPHCNVSMSLHKGGAERMVCHYCGFSIYANGHCGKCGGPLKSLGAGTQKIEEEAAALFPHARIARLDGDNAQSNGYESRIIREFGKGNIDILIGTQMLAKGFDFSNLRLVAVIAADTLLGMQDFRADEKAVQILEQFRGRCGRRDRKGRIVIQTSQPEHPVYQRFAEGNTGTFSSALLLERKDFNFPPFTRIIEIAVRDRSEERACREAAALAGILGRKFEITGPYPPAVDKVADQFIRIIRINMRKDKTLASGKSAIKELTAVFEKERKYDGHITINVDPS